MTPTHLPMFLGLYLPGGWEWLIILALFAFWLWMLIHAIIRPSKTVDRVVAILVIVLFPVFGAIVYFFFGYLRKAPADR